jgi:hypothetical protein
VRRRIGFGALKSNPRSFLISLAFEFLIKVRRGISPPLSWLADRCDTCLCELAVLKVITVIDSNIRISLPTELGINHFSRSRLQAKKSAFRIADHVKCIDLLFCYVLHKSMYLSAFEKNVKRKVRFFFLQREFVWIIGAPVSHQWLHLKP